MTALLSTLTALQDFGMTTPDGERITADAVGPAFSFSAMGFMAWPITFCGLMVIVLVGRAIWRMRAGGPEQAVLARSTIDGSLFWGSYALALGILGTVLGLVVAAQAIEALGQVETRLVWGGVKVALTTTVYGMLVFLASALLWLGLRSWHRRTALSGA